MSDSADKPPAKPRKRVDYGTGREALLNAAVRVVARGGLRKLTYRAVAEEAGVTHGLVMHHFGSRDALIEAALEHAVRTSTRISSLEPGTGDIADFAAGLADMVTREPAMQIFQYELMLESRRRPELLPQIRALYDEYFQATERELSRSLPDGTSPALTRLVFAALEGLVLHQLVLDEPNVTEAAMKELRSLLTRQPGDPE
ncbi:MULTISPECIES: TetR/AcrR family transcriptional regulator [Streptomyces]|jgi:AcrR family transcriptional regulator|uniref:HTH-type transcriptional repressor n=1 Tax=Streptomyces griseorubiginosus TaxID=67304 RepID=A0AAI8KV60_9ACTN|nr:TetR family transcriptional regulator [Streptomyces griseorubiginosus]AYC36134.1 HTH-type transcriptional repressor [Streptomyces griseorubiginosus]KUM81404.1 TetR family transcriptional regulator [Streptomyces griseorubiginosus]